MKITCIEKEKEVLIDMFNDKHALCPFNKVSVGCTLSRKCSECIQTNLNIEWEIVNK